MEQKNSLLENKKILFFLDTLLMGGAEKQASLLADHLKNVQKADVQVWAFYGVGKCAEFLDRAGVPWRIFEFNKHAGRITRVKRLIHLVFEMRKFKPDVIMPYTHWPNIICGSIWNFTRAKSCIWNQRDEGRRVISGHLQTKYALKKTPAFVANSEEGRMFLSRQLNMDKNKIHLIYNSVQLSPPVNNAEYWKKSLGLDGNYFVATMVANLHSYKDHTTLLKAWKKVCDNLHDARPVLLLAGRFDNKYEDLVRLAAQLEISGSVKFLGQVDDVSGLLTCTQLAVFSSKFEGCPNGVLESMKAGLPIVATDITGTREALGNEYPFLVPMDDAELFADKILTFANDEELRKETGSKNYERASDLFSPGKMFLNYTNLVNELLT